MGKPNYVTAGVLGETVMGEVPRESGAGPDLARLVFHGAWMSVALGLALQLAALAVGLAFGKSPEVNSFVAELTQKVSWSVFVCVGLTVGAAAARLLPMVTGVVGLLAAPLAFVVAKVAQKWVQEMLKIPPSPAGAPTALTLAMLKGAEYAVFGWALARLARTPGRGLRWFAGLGAIVGVVFAAVVVGMVLAGAPARPPMAALTARALNEALFPVGCAVVFCVTMKLGSLARA